MFQMMVGHKEGCSIQGGTANSGGAKFVAVFGRHRIEKTFLIRQSFGSFAFKPTVIQWHGTAKLVDEFIKWLASQSRSLISMCALAGLANCAKADIVSAQEQRDGEGNIKSIVVNNPTASIGSKATPWMFVRPDGKSGFANDFTTNAISVVSEDGTNYYAHVEDQNGDRTKVIHFTVNKDGIPNTHGDIIDMADVDEGMACEMANRKLVGVANGHLCFYPTERYGVAWIYDQQYGNYYDEPSLDGSRFKERCLAYCQDGSNVYVLCNFRYTTPNNEMKTATKIRKITGDPNSMVVNVENFLDPLSDEKRVMVIDRGRCYIGDSEGRMMQVESGGMLRALKQRLPGPVSSITISDNRKDIFATSTATNAFFNFNLDPPQYNAVSGDGGSVKPMVPGTNEGLIRMIDNRSKGGKLMYVTPKGIHSIDD